MGLFDLIPAGYEFMNIPNLTTFEITVMFVVADTEFVLPFLGHILGNISSRALERVQIVMSETPVTRGFLEPSDDWKVVDGALVNLASITTCILELHIAKPQLAHVTKTAGELSRLLLPRLWNKTDVELKLRLS